MLQAVKNKVLWIFTKAPETTVSSPGYGTSWKGLFGGFAKKIIEGLGRRFSMEGISSLFCRKKKYGAAQAGDVMQPFAPSHILKIAVSVRDSSKSKCWDSAGSFELSRSAVSSDDKRPPETKISRAAGWIKRRIFVEKPKQEAASKEMITINSFLASAEDCRRLLSDESANRLAEEYFTLIKKTK